MNVMNPNAVNNDNRRELLSSERILLVI